MVCARSWRGPEFQADGPQAPRGVVSGQSVLTPAGGGAGGSGLVSFAQDSSSHSSMLLA